MIQGIEDLFSRARPAFAQTRTWLSARRLMFSVITCLGRRTVTGIICAQGGQYTDWSKVYRLFGCKRFKIDALMTPIRTVVDRHTPKHMPLIAAMDDTIIRKRGRKVAGTAWRRDPLASAFGVNFVWSQRFIQVSMIAPTEGCCGPGRGIPVDIHHAPTPKKPRKAASEEEWEKYRKQQEEARLSKVGAERIEHLRTQLNLDPMSRGRVLVMAVDGAYTNRTVFKNIPERTTLIGRIRKDAALFAAPPAHTGRGRARLYGEPIKTPEELRQDETIPWQKIQAYAAGKVWEFEVKTATPVRWKGAGGRDLRLLVIRPIAFRPTKGSRLQYRDPAYLICTDPDLPIQQMLQAYLWRWEIEVNFRDEKTLMGVGQTQVRTPAAVQATTAFTVASYAMMSAAALETGMSENGIPLPKWRKNNATARCTTNQLISRVRAELWGKSLGVTNFSGFMQPQQIQRSLQKSADQMQSAVIYATG